MIKDLQEKTFKMNVDNNNAENSIIMKKRENTNKNNSGDIGKTKVIENQMFDIEGNILTSLKNSFNQSMIGDSVNSRMTS